MEQISWHRFGGVSPRRALIEGGICPRRLEGVATPDVEPGHHRLQIGLSPFGKDLDFARRQLRTGASRGRSMHICFCTMKNRESDNVNRFRTDYFRKTGIALVVFGTACTAAAPA